ncbi:MAG TPA: hypothetical protein VFB63_02260 [Bryobacteraceae bacterium]|jgi:adenylate cyclase|nr:hypothetical protein [Bryobacteraceae bacterium]
MQESPPIDVVRDQLERVLASQVLAGSDQLKRLLRLVVERSLDGQSTLLKEYNLGLEVFQRPPDYDPKIDPIVRVQARRLRAKLDEYYAGEGAADTVVIMIPKGAYAPVFEQRPNGAVAHAGTVPRRWVWLVLPLAAAAILSTSVFWDRFTPTADPDRSVAVLPLKLFAQDRKRSHIADQTTEVLTTEIARNKNLRVVSRTTASQYGETTVPLPEIARTLGVRWVVEGGIGFEGSRAYVKLRVVDASFDRKAWAEVYDFETHNLIASNARIAAQIASAIEAARKDAGRR